MNNSDKNIRTSRVRKNILKEAEFRVIEVLCRVMPSWITSDMLTFIGILGSAIIAIGMVLALQDKYWLFLSIAGFAVQWFGDSLDGRLAYYRNKPRKWYGWALDINADWISACIIGFGFYFYFPSWKVVSFLFVAAYGGSMILALLRYKIIDKYIIDTHLLGPTELRIIISFFLLLEIFIPGILLKFAFVGSLILMVINVTDSIQIFKLGDKRDIQEKKLKAALSST